MISFIEFKRLLDFFLLLINICIFIYGITTHYIVLDFILFYLLIILISTLWIINRIKHKYIFLIIVSIYIFVFFTLNLYPKHQRFLYDFNKSKIQFLKLPQKHITKIKVIAIINNMKGLYRIEIINENVINEFKTAIKKSEEFTGINVQMVDYYAITFIDDQNDKYSIALKANCNIENRKRSSLCNLLYLRLNYATDEFEEEHPIYGGDIWYHSDELVQLLNKYVDTLIKQNPGKYYQQIKI